VSGSGISWAICKSAPCSREITTPAPHYSVLQAGCPSCRPTNSVKAHGITKENFLFVHGFLIYGTVFQIQWLTVDADTLSRNTLKSRLDKHWFDKDVLYNCHSELTGTGGASICMSCCKRHGQRRTAYLDRFIRIGLDNSGLEPPLAALQYVMYFRFYERHVPTCVYSINRATVSGVRQMNEVNARRARLGLGWVTVFGRVYIPSRHVTS